MDKPSTNKVKPPSLLISIVIVSYNVRDFLEQAINSIKLALVDIPAEIFIVDNNSSDSSPDFIKSKYPDIKLISNLENVGFARANNQALKICTGKYICVINPDTVVQENTFKNLIDFMEDHSDSGAVGCKILNPDGTLQLACRRSFPTPWVAFSKMIGLAKLFPKVKVLGKYNLTYLDPDKTSIVDAISGSFMFLRSEVLSSVGYFDESFFMYGEDLDWCYRIQKAGFNNYYVPTTQIIHFKGESSKKSPFEQRRLFYEAMQLFVNKHFKGGKALMPSWILVFAIWARALFSFLVESFRKIIFPGIDFLFLTVSLSVAIYFRFKPDFPWTPFLIVHLLYSIVWLVSASFHGLYNNKKYSGLKAGSAILLGWLINSALTYFFKQYGFSRAVVLIAGLLNLIFIPGWRLALKWLAKSGTQFWRKKFGHILLNRRTAIVGDLISVLNLRDRINSQIDSEYDLVGMVHFGDKMEKDNDFPNLGEFDKLEEIIQRENIKEVIFATDQIPYHKILYTIAKSSSINIIYKLVPSNLDVIIGKASIEYLDDIPLMDLEYKLNSTPYKRVKRIFDILLAMLLLLLALPVYLVYFVKRTPFAEILIVTNKGMTVPVKVFDNKNQKQKWKSHIPLLFNIIKGQISFVGRPLQMENQLTDISLLLKPGITGLEQLSPTKQSTSEQERLHLFYLKNYTPVFDLEIIFKSLFQKKYKI